MTDHDIIDPSGRRIATVYDDSLTALRIADLFGARTVRVATARIGESWTFPFEFEKLPYGLSMNDSPSSRGARIRQSISVKDVRTQVVNALVAEGIVGRPFKKVEVEVTRYVNTKRVLDPDNLSPLLKATADAIGSNRGISATLVPDDAPEYMRKLMPKIVYTLERPPGYEFTITDISHEVTE